MQPVARRLGLVLCICLGAFCGILHVATFIATPSPFWIFLSFLFITGIMFCANMVNPQEGVRLPARNWPPSLAVGAGLLFAYAILTLVYFYRTTGGADSVEIINGHYVSMSKGHVIRTITEREYRMFPNLWTRVMSAWVGMLSVVGINSFVRSEKGD
jgi:hypothetical protein